MKSTFLAVLLSTVAFGAACKTDLLVDSYANVTTTGTNAVGAYSSDDSTCKSISSAANSNTLTLVPGSSRCYYYTNFPNSKPEDATGGGRSNLQFTLTPPSAPWSFKINIKSWDDTAQKLADSYFTPSGSEGGKQVVSIPLTSFNGPDVPNLRNIRSFVIESFSDLSGTWNIGELVLLCAATHATSTSTTTVRSTTTAVRSTATPTTLKTTSSKKATSAKASSTAELEKC